MPVTQSLNSKANVKSTTTNDLPFNAQQPVINSYYATSTASQTVINFGFSITASGTNANTDVFWLFVDGKKLDLGSSNDYTFTNIGSDGTSSQVTLNFSLAANLNIQAFKLGLKQEVQFGMDNRFVQLYAAQSAGFQGFVSQTDFINTATTTAGTPAAGTFYSSIIGRASMVDLSQNLKAQMGIERIPVQQILQIQNEFGPNGEPVYGVLNDTYGQIRFVNGTTTEDDANGTPISINGDGSTTSYMEITFYGTGLNALMFQNASSRDFVASVDGGSETSTLYPSSSNGVLSNRNYNTNTILNCATGLTLGIHTVKLRGSNASFSARISAFEIINVNSTNVVVNPGIGYVQGQKITSGSQQSFAYNSVATGTRGGRVVVYQSASGTIGQAWQAVNSSSATTSSADHTNEEVARTYFPREFGAGRTDDFSNSGTIARFFTLEDGTTTLINSSANWLTSGTGVEGTTIASNNNSIIFTFVGTGIDLQLFDNATGGTDAAQWNWSIDGGTANNWPYTAGSASVRTQKFVSGLPYGTHTLKVTKLVPVTWSAVITRFIVYQPKKPSIPSGSIELSDYNVMSNYDNSTGTGNTTADILKIPQGTLFKATTREFVWQGTGWTIPGPVSDTFSLGFRGGQAVQTTVNGDAWKYTFFGTGLVVEFQSNSGGFGTFTVAIDGTLNASGNTALSSGVITNNGGGTYTGTATSSTPARLEFTGLTLGTHVITVTRTNANGNTMWHTGIDIITPIHSYKSNLYADIQNTLPVGSNAISDNRKSTPVKDILPITKAYSQVTGVSSAPSTTSTSLVPVPDMSCSVKTSGGQLLLMFNCSAFGSVTSATGTFAFYVDGVEITPIENMWTPTASAAGEALSMQLIVPASVGYHKVDVYWATNTGTLNMVTTQRSLTVKEL